MTLLVKDEDDILEENLIFHKSMGVNQFIITDNNSSDRTAEIIKKYQAKGWITDYLVEKNTNYTQALWVGRMIEIAISKYNPDWIVMQMNFGTRNRVIFLRQLKPKQMLQRMF